MNNRLREVEHNAACNLHDVYMWDFFERQMKPVRPRFYLAPAKGWFLLRKFWKSLKADPDFQRAKYTHPVR